jgi:hypothetical protein
MSKYTIKFHPMLGSIGTDEHAVFEKNYKTLLEANTALTAIAEYTLLLHDTSLMNDWNNLAEIYCDGEYLDEDDIEEQLKEKG